MLDVFAVQFIIEFNTKLNEFSEHAIYTMVCIQKTCVIHLLNAEKELKNGATLFINEKTAFF